MPRTLFGTSYSSMIVNLRIHRKCIMNIPRFTAEASLNRTRGHYRTGRNRGAILTARMISPIYPAREMEEDIHIHSCAPGWTDIGGTCWPNPLTEPSGSTSGGGGSMPSEPGGGGSGGGLGDYWVCTEGCETAHSKCLDTCEGTWENPKPSRNCLICDDNYQRCLRNCSRNIA
jgi:hypothetical protein